MPTALVTGGARRLGAHLVRHLAGRGWHVFLHFRSSREEAAELRESCGAERVELLQADLAVPAGRDGLRDRVVEALGGDGLDLLVHNASLFPHRRLEDADDALLDELWAVHVKAPLVLSRDLSPRLAAVHGLVVTMLDAGAGLHWPGYLPYAISKQALEAATIALARQLAPEVRVNGIAPGFILPPEDAPESYRRAETRRLTAEGGGPRHILRALDYLLEAPFVTGEILTVDGGRRWLRPGG
jgi:pteridine reductase